VLVIDDDADTRANLCDILEMDGYQVETAGTAGEALNRTNWHDLSAILLDRRLPDGTAEELLPQLRQLAPEAAVMIITGYADLQGAISALRQGTADYILKPIEPDALRASLARVAERQRLRAAKERSEAAFSALVEAAPCMIVILRPNHRIAYFNRWAEEFTGYSAREAHGQDYFTLFMPGEDPGPIEARLRHIFNGTPMRGVEATVKCKDGSQRWMLWNAQSLPDYEGEPALLAVGQDISSLKQAQEQALQAERLAAIGQMMTGLAHESGNALARSQACLEMLALEVPDRPEVQDLINRIQQAQQHLRQLYEEVRGYAAPIKLERDTWDLSLIWRQAWENLALRRQGKKAELHAHTEEVDLHCSVDSFRLEQVFRNIFENSLAACPEPVRLDIHCSQAMLARRPALRVAVRDNGPGLGPEQRRRIFEPFFTTKTKGTGLGMAIAKRILEAHGGQIAVGARDAPGAEIVLVLPRETP
jgi:PAS domain S-box-containing protein